jgi:hypothetical protein
MSSVNYPGTPWHRTPGRCAPGASVWLISGELIVWILRFGTVHKISNFSHSESRNFTSPKEIPGKENYNGYYDSCKHL